ncbi:hypothetical protein ROJ8625_03015 [Roseivivax jejudonensis]|uniref:Uncharacterized protein n=1 Tax=Roseivivax jejudonensis TaxID=1529041 RepID=A0A1X6ZSB4_9RHOB|nr:hypothetical protein [Roseivivax jejudonensis]SLN59613.1 hypothetical protein ROJ8625_03015 [Roseivivax jejudonensis]
MTDRTHTTATTRAEQALAVLAEQLSYWTPAAPAQTAAQRTGSDDRAFGAVAYHDAA